jgi:radical SAM superfamily enzyme YgiQ (UPF0313 family)
MKIILINPPFNLIRQGYGSRAKIKYGNMPPLGIGYIASVLLELGHKVKIIDSPALGYTNKEVIKEIIRWGTDVVGISALTASSDSAYSLATEIKKKIDVPIILGGPHAIAFPEEVLKDCQSIDISVFGEGEVVIRNLIDKISNRDLLYNVNGICFRDKNGNIIKTPLGEYELNLDNYPSPAWNLYDFSLYSSLPRQYKALPIAPLVSSRGCPWRCTFCFQAAHKLFKYRRHSPERIVSEIENLYLNFGIREIMFWDDTFAMNINWIERFCNLLKERGITIPWSCYGRVDTVNKRMLQLMKEAGCWNIFIGYESGCQELLDKIKKGTTIEQAIRATRWIHETGMEIRGSFMLALPGETPEKAKKTIAFAINLDLTYAQFLPTFPEPGTELYHQALKEGKITEKIKYKGRTKAVYVPDGYRSAEEVEKMVRIAYIRFYLRPKYIWKHVKKIKSLKDLKSYFDGLRFVLGIIFR